MHTTLAILRERKTIIETHVSFTQHAEERCALRSISLDEVLYAIRYGRKENRAGTEMYFLGRKDIPHQDRDDRRIRQLEGLCVQTIRVKGNGILVLTVYRNRERGLKDQRRKSKYSRRRQVA